MAAGIAVVTERAGQRLLLVQAANLEPSSRREEYEVWLYNSRQDAQSLGKGAADERGTFQGITPWPADAERYRFIDVSREAVDENRAHSGNSVLRGRMPELRQASGG